MQINQSEPNSFLLGLELTFEQWVIFLYPVIIFVIALAAGYIIRKILFNRLMAWAKKSQSQMDDIIISSIKGPSLIWCLMLSLYLATKFSTLEQDKADLIGKILLVLGIISFTIVIANVLGKLIAAYSQKTRLAIPVTSLTQNLVRIIVLLMGFLIVLNSMGIPIAPIIATLGIGGLAVALALQETLANLFAGFYIIISRQIKVGDYIKLDTGEEGYVTDINWRATKIRMLPNNIVLVPNDKLTKAIVINYYLPDKELAVLVNLGVHYKSDLQKVEKVTCEVAKEVMKEVAGGVPEFEPFIRYNTFGDSSINFTAVLRAKEFNDQYLIKHEFIKRLHERYNKEGIVIPYPIRAINYEQEKE
jgi:small-conductance mechanosensitive channel